MKKQTSKFSLVEILVVVAIIGILSSLLLPALGQARKKSKLALCTSNIRQISTALFMYTSDQDQYLPYSHNLNNGNSSWDDKLGVYDYDGRGLDESAFQKESSNGSSIYGCPATEVELQNQSRSLRSYSLNYGKEGNSNGKFRGFMNSNSWSMKITNINNTGRTIMITENHRPGNYVSVGNNGHTNNNFIKDQYSNMTFWAHDYAKLNFGTISGSSNFMSLQHTYLGLRDASANGNQKGTMWDCQN